MMKGMEGSRGRSSSSKGENRSSTVSAAAESDSRCCMSFGKTGEGEGATERGAQAAASEGTAAAPTERAAKAHGADETRDKTNSQLLRVEIPSVESCTASFSNSPADSETAGVASTRQERLEGRTQHQLELEQKKQTMVVDAAGAAMTMASQDGAFVLCAEHGDSLGVALSTDFPKASNNDSGGSSNDSIKYSAGAPLKSNSRHQNNGCIKRRSSTGCSCLIQGRTDSQSGVFPGSEKGCSNSTNSNKDAVGDSSSDIERHSKLSRRSNSSGEKSVSNELAGPSTTSTNFSHDDSNVTIHSHLPVVFTSSHRRSGDNNTEHCSSSTVLSKEKGERDSELPGSLAPEVAAGDIKGNNDCTVITTRRRGRSRTARSPRIHNNSSTGKSGCSKTSCLNNASEDSNTETLESSSITETSNVGSGGNILNSASCCSSPTERSSNKVKESYDSDDPVVSGNQNSVSEVSNSCILIDNKSSNDASPPESNNSSSGSGSMSSRRKSPSRSTEYSFACPLNNSKSAHAHGALREKADFGQQRQSNSSSSGCSVSTAAAVERKKPQLCESNTGGRAAKTGGGGTGCPDNASRFECNICFEEATDPVVTRCGHLFCWQCLHAWLQRGPGECPVCKAFTAAGSVIPIYGRGGEKHAADKKNSEEATPARPRADPPRERSPRTRQEGSPWVSTGSGRSSSGSSSERFSQFSFGFSPFSLGMTWSTSFGSSNSGPSGAGRGSSSNVPLLGGNPFDWLFMPPTAAQQHHQRQHSAGFTRENLDEQQRVQSMGFMLLALFFLVYVIFFA